MEKYILRKAFDLPHDPYLPDHVLYRQKEQFSDGVGYDWVNGLKAFADKVQAGFQIALCPLEDIRYDLEPQCLCFHLQVLIESSQILDMPS